MLNSEQVYAKLDKFGPRTVHQITWAIIEDIRQYFFCTVTRRLCMRDGLVPYIIPNEHHWNRCVQGGGNQTGKFPGKIAELGNTAHTTTCVTAGNTAFTMRMPPPGMDGMQ